MDRSSRYASNIRARSTRPAGSVRDCAITLNFAVSASSSASSIARRHAAICPNPSLHAPHRLYGNRKSTDESPAYDNFYGIDRLVLAKLHAAGFLPEVWQPDEATERLRRQVARRATIVQSRTRVKNRIQ